MYEILKNLIPKAFIKRNEPMIRQLLSLFYMGNRFQCSVCEFKMSKFITLKTNDKLCPKCGSLARTRRLYEFIVPKAKNVKILHFSPSKSIKKRLGSLKNVTYITTDYAGEFEAMKRLNIESIDEPDNQYDIIICYHVLEHIENDLRAMQELYRITKSGGVCIIQTPFKEGDIYEDTSLKSEAERLIHFGQKDHVRIYSIEGLMRRLSTTGFNPTENNYKESINNRHGFKTLETIIVAKKPS